MSGYALRSIGLARVQNARGLTVHRVVLDKQGAIEDYYPIASAE